MPDDPIENEIREVMADEKRRSRRPRDAEAEKLRKHRLEALREILALKREEDVVAAIRALGHGDDPKELAEALQIWRSFSSSRKS